MSHHSIVECRSITHCCTQLGDPTKDIWEYQIYTFLGAGKADFDLQQYASARGEHATRLISREPTFLKLGHQYKLTLTEKKANGPLLCVQATWNSISKRFEVELRSTGPSSHWFWPNLYWTLWADKFLTFQPEHYYDIELHEMQ